MSGEQTPGTPADATLRSAPLQQRGAGSSPRGTRAEALDVFVLTGPTACGKSEVGLLLAERTGAEIVSVDSMKVYRRMDIGTAKPGPEERSRVPHHLIDIREPWETYTVGDWVTDAERASRGIVSRGRAVIMEGGTPLYLKAFLDGLFFLEPDTQSGSPLPKPDEELRARLREEARRSGLASLHARLAKVDPEAAARIHPNDERRIVRALEVYEQTGIPMSEHQKPSQTGRGSARAWVKARLVALNRPREVLRERIARRVDRMIEAGFVDEVKGLVELERETGRPVSRPASGALGYGELREYLQGLTTLAEARDRIVRETFRFVRKQLTWLRSFDDLVWVEASDDPGRDADRVRAAWRGTANDRGNHR